jgi:hypothetical protein
MSKSLQLLDVTVRRDWRDLMHQAEIQRLRIWRAVEIAVGAVTLLALIGRFASPQRPWIDMLRVGLLAVLFWMLPLWTLLRSHHAAGAALERAIAWFVPIVAAIGIACITWPGVLFVETDAIFTWLPLLAVTIPCLTWPILRQIGRRFPVQSGQLGLVSAAWPINLALGALAGCALGLHLWLTARFLPDLARPAGPIGLWLLWTACYLAGLMSLGQELLLRGLAYDAVLAGSRDTFIPAAAKIVLLNLLIYMAWLALLPGAKPIWMAWLLAYGAVLACLATWLRHRQQSLLPGVAASVVFGLFTVALFGL